MPGIAISRIVHALEDARLVTVTEDEHLLPGRDLGKISVQEVIDVARNEQASVAGPSRLGRGAFAKVDSRCHGHQAAG